ncbi:MAG: ferrous iron transport protein A [bacterium]|nr:ferrous iron transport protein A [bacterium]
MQITLSDLDINQEGQIVTVQAEGDVRRRLLDMGLVRGVKLKVLRKAPLGDPIAVFLKGFHLSLRIEEAKCIIVKKISNDDD